MAFSGYREITHLFFKRHFQRMITEPLLGRLLACKVDSWSQSVIDYQRGRKEGGSFRPFTRLSSASIRGWPRPEKIPSTPDDWLVVIKHSMEFAFVVVKSGRLGCFENKRPIFTWSRESKEAIRRKVTKVLTRLSRRTLSKTQTHARCYKSSTAKVLGMINYQILCTQFYNTPNHLCSSRKTGRIKVGSETIEAPHKKRWQLKRTGDLSDLCSLCIPPHTIC